MMVAASLGGWELNKMEMITTYGFLTDTLVGFSVSYEVNIYL